MKAKAKKKGHAGSRGSAVARERGWPLTEKQKKLCHEYIKDYNVKAAAIRAGYSEQRADKSVPSLIRQLAPYITQLQNEKTKVVSSRIAIDQDDLLQSLARVVYHDPRDYIEVVEIDRGDGKKVTVQRQKSITDLTTEQAQLISEFSEGPDGRIHYKLERRDTARQLLGKHMGLFHDKLIAEHRHAHIHAKMDTSGLTNDQLREGEQALLRILGPAGARLLGYVQPPPDEE